VHKVSLTGLEDAQAEFIITCDGAYRGGKDIPLKSVIDDALIGNKKVKKVIVYTRTRIPVSMIKGTGSLVGR
jgi:acetyl-CoA synthetase